MFKIACVGRCIHAAVDGKLNRIPINYDDSNNSHNHTKQTHKHNVPEIEIKVNLPVFPMFLVTAISISGIV
jgi:hypothetical protein